ncbi:MAG: nitrilase family protein [Bacteroidales bacterium]|nr:nitrilase family protein [Bacteroidales bacterium]
MKICLIQFNITWGDPQANCAKLDELLARAPQAELYVLPEMFTTGFATLPDATVEHEPSAGLAWMQRKAAELHAAVAGSIALEIRRSVSANDEKAPCVNRFYFVRPDGSYEQYDKRHLFGYGGEGERFRAGTERVVVKYMGVRFLLAVCYDLRFPVWLRNRDDYDAILFVASWPGVRRFAWDTLSRARAIENACYVGAVNRIGSDPACEYDGGTALISPYGETLAQVEDNQEGFACGEIDLAHLVSYHRKFPVLEDADNFDLK